MRLNQFMTVFMTVLVDFFQHITVSGTTVAPNNSLSNTSHRSHNLSSTREQPCNSLDIKCLRCSYNTSCIYGGQTTANCTVLKSVACRSPSTFTVKAPCYYCYQLPTTNYTCPERAYCQSKAGHRERIIVNCSVSENQHCLGNRNFSKSFLCNWTSGYRWSTSLILSVTLGGFGVDRFYLGHWEEGLGKLFSFGGLGVWTLLDIILIGVGYITPADGSLYIF